MTGSVATPIPRGSTSCSAKSSSDTVPQKPVPHLPNEILDLILAASISRTEVDRSEVAHIAAFSQVSRRFHAIALPHLSRSARILWIFRYHQVMSCEQTMSLPEWSVSHVGALSEEWPRPGYGLPLNNNGSGQRGEPTWDLDRAAVLQQVRDSLKELTAVGKTYTSRIQAAKSAQAITDGSATS